MKRIAFSSLLFAALLLLSVSSFADDYKLTDFTLSPALSAEWKTMHESKGDALEQFNQDKFGMFIHWGLYSLISGEWNGHPIEGLGEWAMYSESIPRDEYAALGKQFNPVKFDAAEWVSLAKNAGMKYIVITAKHHDGFAMFSSKYSDFDIADRTPCDFEPLDLLYEECQKQGIGLGFYYSHVIDWYDGWSGEGGWPDDKQAKRNYYKSNPMNSWDPSGNSREHYLRDKSYPQVQELLERFPHLYSIWFDYWYKGKYINPPESFKFYQTVFDAQPKCLVNSRVGHDLGDYSSAGDNVILEEGHYKQWETPGTLNNTWGFNKYDNDWKSEKELIYLLVNIMSRGGNYLLNIGPKPDGSIPEGTKVCMDAIGRWMKVNSDAVYGTYSWQVIHEGESGQLLNGTIERQEKGFNAEISDKQHWFTAKGGNVYSIALEWPKDNKALIQSVNADRVKNISEVSLLGYGKLEGWKLTNDGLAVTLPQADLNTIGYTLKIVTSE